MKMNVIRYRESIVEVSYIETLKIFAFSAFWGVWVLCKRITLQMLKTSNCDWNDIDNPPSCLVDSSIGQHSYMKIKGMGIKLHYIEAGDKSKPTLLLLHGFPDCWISWFQQIPVLSEHFRVIALDLKGFGDSDKPLSRRFYKLEILLEELTIFISSLGASRCAVVGHDLGAMLGWYLIHLNPDLISKFVAISCAHPNVHWRNIPKNSIFNYNWIHFCQLPTLPELDALKNDIALLDRCYKHFKKADQHEMYIDAYKYTFSRREDWTGAINYYRSLPFYRLEDETLRESEVRCLLITGKLDDSVPLENVIKSTEFVQKYYLKVIDDAGHYPHQENPEVVNKVLLEFLLDPPLIRSKKNTTNPGILGKMIDSVSKKVKYSSEIITGMKNDQSMTWSNWLSNSLSLGPSPS